MFFIIMAANCSHCVHFKEMYINNGILEQKFADIPHKFLFYDTMEEAKHSKDIPDEVREYLRWFPFICVSERDRFVVFNGKIEEHELVSVRPGVPPTPENLLFFYQRGNHRSEEISHHSSPGFIPTRINVNSFGGK